MFGRNNKLDVDWLSKVGFFDTFTKAAIEQMAELGHRVDAEPGAELTDQGRYGDVCYLIIEGRANVFMRGEYVTSVEAGTMVGEMALLEHRPRSATVVAETPMVLVSFGTKEFRTILDDNADLRERVHQLLVARERANSARD